MILELALLSFVAQPAVEAAPPAAPVAASSAEERTVQAAERAAVAAEKAAEAAQRIANALSPKTNPDATPATPATLPSNPWVGNVGFGLAFLSGNSQQLTVTATGAADKKWQAWGLGIRANAAYGLSNPSANVTGTTSDVTARRAMGTVRGDRSFGEGFASIFVLGGTEFDHLKNVEFRGYGEAGTGLTFFNQKEGELEKLYLRLDLALRGGYETRFQYFPTPSAVTDPNIAILAPRAALAFRWAFSKYVRFSEELEFIPFVLAPVAGRLLINNTTKLNARLTESLSLSTAVLVNYDSLPPAATPARLPTDVALTVGVEAAF
ncbi:MAG: DUF481 domain-containing protein [Archangium sp.]|nr:DUF481 domain-containing protein [Archangium sp.]